jgi:hypothetical protein
MALSILGEFTFGLVLQRPYLMVNSSYIYTWELLQNKNVSALFCTSLISLGETIVFFPQAKVRSYTVASFIAVKTSIRLVYIWQKSSWASEF